MRYAFAALSLLTAVTIPAVAQDDDILEWLKQYPDAIAEARRTNRPIFLEFRCEA